MAKALGSDPISADNDIFNASFGFTAPAAPRRSAELFKPLLVPLSRFGADSEQPSSMLRQMTLRIGNSLRGPGSVPRQITTA